MNTASQLNRTLTLRLAIIVVISNIIGSGVYKKVAPMMSELHSPGWVLLCWLFGGIITLFGALSNAEVASLLADTGGEYTYYKKIYGRFFSFLYGWSNFAAIKTAAVASVAYVFAESLHSIVHFPPILEHLEHFNILGIFHPFAEFNVKLVTIILIVVLTWINSRGLKVGAGLSSILVLMILLGIAAIVVFGLSSSGSNIPMAFDTSTKDITPITVSAVFTAMLSAFWAYEGWNSVGFLGGEIKNPKRNVPLSITFGLLAVIVVYLLANITYLSLLPGDKLVEIFNTKSSIAAIEAAKTFWGSGGVLFISVLIVVSTLGCTHATMLASSRTYYAMAKEGLFFRKAAQLNAASVPANSLLYQCIWACVLVLSGSFEQLTDMLIFAAFIFYGATTMGVFILRKKMPDAPRSYKVWGYPVVPAIFILFCAVLIINTFITRPREAGIGLVLILLGVPFYLWFNRNKNNNAPSE